MQNRIALIGFGEAGSTFALAGGWAAHARVFDVNTHDAAGVLDEVLASLDASDTAKSWHERADYHLGQMVIHGLRRAAEMGEVMKALDRLGTDSAMTHGTVERQRTIGLFGVHDPAPGLTNNLLQLNDRMVNAA